jgi:intein/homing endonuclease
MFLLPTYRFVFQTIRLPLYNHRLFSVYFYFTYDLEYILYTSRVPYLLFIKVHYFGVSMKQNKNNNLLLKHVYKYENLPIKNARQSLKKTKISKINLFFMFIYVKWFFIFVMNFNNNNFNLVKYTMWLIGLNVSKMYQ